MNKILLSVVLSITCFNTTLAQEYVPWDIYITPKIGACYTGFSTLNCEYKPSFIGGVAIEVFLMSHLSFENQLSFSMEGANKVKNSIDQKENNYNLNYLNTDYLLKWYLGNHFKVFTGLHIGRLVWATSNGIKIEDELHKGSLSLPVGLGLDLGHWTVEACFNYSIPKIAKTEFAHQVLKDAMRMGGLVTIGYRIHVF